MSNRLFQGIIHQMKLAVDRTIGVVDASGTIICCSDLTRIGETGIVDMKEVLSSGEIKVIGGKTFLAISAQNHPDSAIFVDGNDESAKNYAKLISGVLRWRMPIDRVIKLVDSLQLDSENINTWKNGVERALKKYVVDGTKAEGQKCPNCNLETLVYQEGCLICKNCGTSRCG